MKKKNKPNNIILKTLPSVSELLESTDLIKYQIPYPMIIDIARATLSEIREKIINNSILNNISKKDIYQNFIKKLDSASKPNLKNVINGTGIILHTGMGRAPFSREIINKCLDRLIGYTNLELDLNNGKRGQRLSHVENLISVLTGSEQAVVVNNNAAAVLLSLNTLSEGREVIISRGQMVEIGGSFRIPDVIEKSSALIREIGTTNRTHLKDYEKNINRNTGVILTAHTSNYMVKGFTKMPETSDLNLISKKYKVPHIIDLGSGALIDLSKLNMPHEPNVKTYINSGVDLVTFSGDKLLGGPQSGIICGKKSLIKKIKNNAMYRALRCDKLTLIFLEETLKTYYTDSSIHKTNLTWSLFTRRLEEIKILGEEILKLLPDMVKKKSGLKLLSSKVEAGSGSLPIKSLNSMELLFNSETIKAKELYQRFLKHNPSIIGYIHAKKYRIDLKAIPEYHIETIIKSINKIFL